MNRARSASWSFPGSRYALAAPRTAKYGSRGLIYPMRYAALQRRGLTWRLMPTGSDCPVFMSGQRLGGVCALPFNVPFRAGPYCFTLRQDRSAQPDWHMYAGPAPLQDGAIEKPPLAELEPDPLPVTQSPPLAAVIHRRIGAPPPVPNTASLRRNTVKPPLVDKRREPKQYGSTPLDSYEQWDARWKALNAKVSARAESRLKAPEFNRPVYRSDLEPVPLREAHTPLIEVPASADPIREPEPETIVSQPPVPAPTSLTETVELAQQFTEFLTEPVVEEPLNAALETDDLSVVDGVAVALDLIPAQQTANATAVDDDPDVQQIIAPQTSDLLAVDDVPDAQYQDDSQYDTQPRHAAPLLAKDVEWPSARDILAAYQAARPRQSPVNAGKSTTKKISRSSLTPTAEREPSHWAPPIVLTGPVAVIFVLAAGLLGCSLSWSWAQDSYAAAIVTDRLLTNDLTLQRSPLPDSVQPPSGNWLTSTPAHLASWAVFLGHFRGAENQTPDETLALLERALAASPVNSQARLMQALFEPVDSTKAVSSRSVGLSRDVASLSCSARRLVTAGKKDEALAAFGTRTFARCPGEVVSIPRAAIQ